MDSMAGDARTLLETALDLDDRARADLAAHLLASLDHDTVEDQADVEQAWADEARQRARDVLSGTSPTTDWADIRTRIANRHHE